MPRAGPLRGPPNPTRAPRQEWELGPQRAPKNQPQTARVVLSNKTAADPRAHVVLLDTKNDDHRGMPLHPRAVAALANLQHRTGPVFRRPDKKPYEPMDGEGGQFKTAFRGACRRAGISDFHPHDCRHTWATWHYSANRDLAAPMTLGGWRTVAMVLRYAHINVSNLAPGVMKLGENPGTAEAGSSVSPQKQGHSA